MMSKKLNPDDFTKSFDKTCDYCFLKITMRKPVDTTKKWLPCKYHAHEFHMCSSMKKAYAGEKKSNGDYPDGPPETFPEEKETVSSIGPCSIQGAVDTELSVKYLRTCPLQDGKRCVSTCGWFSRTEERCAILLIANKK